MTEREYYGQIAMKAFDRAFKDPLVVTNAECFIQAAEAVRNAPAYIDPVEEIANRMKGIVNEQSASPHVHEKYRALAAFAISRGAKP